MWREFAMTNDELITVLRAELAGFQGRIRDDVQEALGVFKVEMREEINTAVQASEARMIQRMDQMQKNILEIKGNVALLDNKVDQFSLVLDETTTKIASIQNDLYNLENKLDTHINVTMQMKQHLQRIDTAVQTLTQQVFEINRRLFAHIATPWDKAHPGPNSAA
jgi:chromosome segregation ATPase